MDARENIVEERSLNSIDGACYENAIYLCDYILDNTNYEPYIRWGVVSNHTDYSDLELAERDGKVHFWVEINISDDNWVIADLFTMDSHPNSISRGDIFVSDEILESYQQLDDTLFKYNPIHIKPCSILDYMDYEYLKMKTIPVE